MTKPVDERFFSFVEKANGCWLWSGGKDRKGYGIFHLTHPRTNIQAHRQSWIFKNGPIAPGLCVLHHCDVSHCVNPDHLFLGTMKHNTADMMEKRRGKFFGHPQKLTPTDVLKIRELYMTGNYTLKKLGKMYNCHFGTIYDAIHRRWKSVH